MEVVDDKIVEVVEELQLSVSLHVSTSEFVSPHSKSYHSHVQLVMEGDKGDRAGMDEAWGIMEEVLEVLGSRAEVQGVQGVHQVGGRVSMLVQ